MPETLEAQLARLERENRALRNVVRIAQAVAAERVESTILFRVGDLRRVVADIRLYPEGTRR
jgi:hypothetical protein